MFQMELHSHVLLQWFLANSLYVYDNFCTFALQMTQISKET